MVIIDDIIDCIYEEISKETTATATLIANNNTNSATASYNVYLNINFNNFVYTTADKKPEIVAKIIAPDGTEVKNITGLTHVSVVDSLISETIQVSI